MFESTQIAIPPIFSFKEILWFLDRKYDDCLYEVGPASVTRLIERDGDWAIARIKSDGTSLIIERLSGTLSMEELKRYVTVWFDLDRDLQPFYKSLEKSPLAYMTSSFHGLRMVGIPNLFEALCWCIIGQQINLSFAYTIKRRFVEAYGNSEMNGDVRFYSFPRPDQLAIVTMDELKDMQFSRQKADYILNLAHSFREGSLSYEAIKNLPLDDLRKSLLSLRGVGEWTANYVLMKTFGDADSVPYGDVGLFAALEKHNIISDRKDRETIESFVRSFSGWGSYLTIYLWRSLTAPDF